jgi:transportin-1
MSGLPPPPPPPPPSGQALSLVSALSNSENHQLHLQAIRARDDALSASSDSYGNLCVQLAYVFAGSDNPAQLVPRIAPADMQAWQQTDSQSANKLLQDENLWTPFGQMAGLVLKNALLRPPVGKQPASSSNGAPQQAQTLLYLRQPAADHVKETLLYCLGCRHAELRAVASSVIATTAVSLDGVQPLLHVKAWPQLIPTLIRNLQQVHVLGQGQEQQPLVEGSLSTIRKIMEDGPNELNYEELDALVPVLLHFLSPSHDERFKTAALQSLVACLSEGLMPSALVLEFDQYLTGLSNLAQDPSHTVRQWVCRSMVTLLELRAEYIQPHMASVCQFMLSSTADHGSSVSGNNSNSNTNTVALEACEFWLTLANLHDTIGSSEMLETVGAILPQLIPVLVRSMVYSVDKQQELLLLNEMDQQEEQVLDQQQKQAMRPVFHKSRAKQPTSNSSEGDSRRGSSGVSSDNDIDTGDDDEDDGYESDDEGDGDGFDDEDNEWTLRKCAAASLDSLANLYGAEPILPCLLPSLQAGLSSSDPWVQEASILALGAIAEGCREEMDAHMGQLHPYLMSHIAAPEAPQNLPQVKSIAAWTIGRYAAWAVEQVQSGVQGHLLAQMTEIFLARLGDRNRRVQVACCSAFGVVMEVAGDLMAPYLEPVYQGLTAAVSRYQGRSLLILFDVLGILADFCGAAIAEGNLPAIYMPTLLHLFDTFAKNDPTDRTLLPLMECIASIALASGMNFQPYALECFEDAMGVIEAVTLLLTTSDETIENEEDVDPIICATDLLDGLVEGIGENFPALVSSSRRFGQHFLSVLLSMCQHDIPGVRMSALALLGDIARNSPAMLEPALPQLLKEAITNMDPVQPSVCTNAVWAIGEICVRCEGHSTILEPFAPALMQNLTALLMGNGVNGSGRGADIPGLAENAAACVGRLAKVNPNFVAPDLSRVLLGWCDGMAKIRDPTERRDAFQGFVQSVYANPQAIQQAAANVADAIASVLFAIVTWHMPSEVSDQSTALLTGEYKFRPFPQTEHELGTALARLIQDLKSSVGEDTWHSVQKELPVNVRRLLREAYQL